MKEATSESTIKQEEIPVEAYHVIQLTLESGVVHHTDETWLVRGITFCGKCGAWASSAPRLLTKACPKEPGKRVYDLRRLTARKEPNRRTAWPSDTPLVPVRMLEAPSQYISEVARVWCAKWQRSVTWFIWYGCGQRLVISSRELVARPSMV